MAEVQEALTYVPRTFSIVALFLSVDCRSRVLADHNSPSASSLSKLSACGSHLDTGSDTIASAHGKPREYAYERHTYEVIRCSYEVRRVERVRGRQNLSERSCVVRGKKWSDRQSRCSHTAWEIATKSLFFFCLFDSLLLGSFFVFCGVILRIPAPRFERCPFGVECRFGCAC